MLRREGIEAVRSGLTAVAPFVPTQAELDNLRHSIDGAAVALPNSRRPVIRVMGGDLADATAAALRVLASERDPLAAVYVRGSLLVRPTRIRERLNAGSIRRPLDALILRAVDLDWLRLRLAQLADFYVIAMKKLKPVDVPVGVCRCVLAAAPWDGLPTLTGIIEAPTILPDGSVIQSPGYDRATGLLFDPGDTQFPQVPSEPTRAQAEAALRTLSDPFQDFPFIDEPSRSVALAAVLTVLVRRGLRAAPLFGFDAPKMGSGKTLIATVCSYIATGRGPYLMAQVADPTDERKRLLIGPARKPGCHRPRQHRSPPSLGQPVHRAYRAELHRSPAWRVPHGDRRDQLLVLRHRQQPGDRGRPECSRPDLSDRSGSRATGGAHIRTEPA